MSIASLNPSSIILEDERLAHRLPGGRFLFSAGALRQDHFVSPSVSV
jgi:hypothetical protein